MSAAKKETDLWYEHRDERHRVVVIEYYKRKPHSVVTEHHWDHSGKPWFNPTRDRASGVSAHNWDFDWSKRDGVSYFHMSGCGGEPGASVGKFCNPVPPPGEIWVADGIPITTWTARSKKPQSVNETQLLALGYRRLSQPRLLTCGRGGKTRNPFDAAEEGECVWCDLCKDHIYEDSDNPCEHIRWDDELRDWIYIKTGKLCQ